MDRYVYKYAVIVGIDGMGNFNKDTDTPNMDRIFASGAKTLYALSMYPTISAQNWGSMLLGLNPEVHKMTNGSISDGFNEDDNMPSLFREVRKVYPDAILCSYCNWNPINHGIIEHNLGVDMQTADDDNTLCGMIEKCVENKPKLLFIQFDNVDGGGHSHGYGTQGHLDSIKRADEYVGRVYAAYEKAGIIEDTLFTVISDHGGYDHGHGGYSEGEKYIWLACAGKTVMDSEIPFAQAKDINAIVRYGLGLDIPEYDESGYSAQIPENVFTDYESSYRMIAPAPFSMMTQPTPAIDSEKGLLSFANRDDIKLAIFFDNSAEDEMKKAKLTLHQRIKYYTNGRYGSMGELGETGWLTTEDVKFGKGSFSLAVWLKTDSSMKDDCCICGTKAMRKDSRGFMISLTSSETVLVLEGDSPSSRMEIRTEFSSAPESWIHAIYSVDREKGIIDVYHNFTKKQSFDLGGFGAGLDNLPFTIGNECSLEDGREWNGNIFNIDDLLVFGKALSEEDVKKLTEYYGI